jgi:hypothetical protein
MDAIVKARDGSVQISDSSIVRVHQHGSGPKKEWRSLCGAKPGRHTKKTHARGPLSRAQSRRALLQQTKQSRRIATRYDKLGDNCFAFVKLACMRIWLRSIESTA